MTAANLIFTAISVLLGGGGLVAIGQYLIARRRVPVELDSVAVQGSESAVLTMERVNQALERRAIAAETERDQMKERVGVLERQLAAAQQLLDQMRHEIASIRRDVV